MVDGLYGYSTQNSLQAFLFIKGIKFIDGEPITEDIYKLLSEVKSNDNQK